MNGTRQPAGPLAGVRVVEFAALGPAPMAAMFLADLGAEVLRIERVGETAPLFTPELDVLRRSRTIIRLDLKQPAGAALALDLIGHADLLIEGFRPQVMERLGLGPEPCLERNPKLVYGRATGWGQTGPWAGLAGHDINFIAVSGVLGTIGEAGRGPVPPLNLVADGGGAFLLALGMVSAFAHVRAGGPGQVVDAAMVDGCTLLMSMVHSLQAMQAWQPQRGHNLLDGGAPFYGVYQTRDGRWLAVGAIEVPFYRSFLAQLGLSAAEIDGHWLPRQWQREQWPECRQWIADQIATRTLVEWQRCFDGTDSCVTPVLTLDESAAHPQLAARQSIIDVGGVPQAAPAPRFSATPLARPQSSQEGDMQALLTHWLAADKHNW